MYQIRCKLQPECPMVCNPVEPAWQSWMQLHGDRINGGGLGPSKEILELGLGGEGGCPGPAVHQAHVHAGGPGVHNGVEQDTGELVSNI